MKKLTKEQIKARQNKISALVEEMSNSSEGILKHFRYLLKNDAHKVLGCNKKGLIKGIKVTDKTKSESYLYRLLNQASLELELGLKANTMIESWAREITSNFKGTESREQVWEKAIELADGKSKVRMPEIKQAIKFVKGESVIEVSTPKDDKTHIKELCQHIKSVRHNESIDTLKLSYAINCNKESRALLLDILSISLQLPNEKEHKKLTKKVRNALGVTVAGPRKGRNGKKPDLRAVG